MLKVLQASQLSLHDVEDKFGLAEDTDAGFFTEWQTLPPKLDAYEQKTLDSARLYFKHLLKYPVREEIVKMVIVSPLLAVAGFYQKPFRSVAEQSVEVEALNNNEIVRGRIDVLAINGQVWVAAVEAKGSQFSWSVGLPQALVYMASSASANQPRFGLITNGTEFIFVKLQASLDKYGLSKLFSLHNPGNDFYSVVGVLRAISRLQNQLNN